MAPAEFVAAANLWVAAQAQRIDEQNAQATALNALGDTVAAQAQAAADAAALAAGSAMSAGVIATSSTSNSIDATPKTYQIQSGKLFSKGMFVMASPDVDPSKFVICQVSAYAGTTLDLLAPFITSAGGGGPYTAWNISLAAVPQGLGTYAWWIPVGAITARVTNGAEFGQVETATNKIMLRSLDFDPSTIEYGQVQVRMPKSWDLGGIKFAPIWSHSATSTNFKVSWGLRAVAISDNEAADGAMGTAVFSNDTGGVTNRIYVGPQSAAMTVAGSPAAEDWVIFEIFRKADDGTNDTLAIDARLHGFTLYVQSNAGSDA
jgi:hypothetical protein